MDDLTGLTVTAITRRLEEAAAALTLTADALSWAPTNHTGRFSHAGSLANKADDHAHDIAVLTIELARRFDFTPSIEVPA